MKSSLIIFAIACCAALGLTLFDLSAAENSKPATSDLVVHEWGTFTSVAGKKGTALDWRPLAGASDLPSFVYKGTDEDGFRRTFEAKTSGKDMRLVKVRMETPVIYFYTKNEMEVQASVGFPAGEITEWYPQAGIVNRYAGNNQYSKFQANLIDWGTIRLLPNLPEPEYPREAAESHYYPARETDAVAVQICNADKTKIEREKFLFYRGVGDFDLPLSVRIDGKNLFLTNSGTDEVKSVIVFENRGGRVGFRLIESLTGETAAHRPETDRTPADVYAALEKILVAEGLYQKEARAMIETWKDSWFEEGLRVFYIVSRSATDRVLPLKIEPRPKETVRVMVGRTEIITPEMERDVRRQVELLRSESAETRRRAQDYLKKYGRFYEPVLKSLLESENDATVRARIEELIKIG